MKRTLIIITAIIFACLIPPLSASAATELELCYWTIEQSDEIESAINRFNTVQNKIHVNVNVIPFAQYFNKLSVSLPAGAAPDIILVNPINEIDYAKKGYLLDISDLFKSKAVDVSKFPQFVLDTHTIDGKLRSVPKDFDSIAVYYNKELFDKAGVPYPKSGWTWEEFIRTAKKLTDPKRHIYGAGLPADTQCVLFDYIYQCGGTVFDKNGKCRINSPQTAEALHKIRDAIYVDKISPTVDDFAETTADVMFQSGTLAMCFSGSWNMNQFRDALGDKLSAVSLPVMKKYKTISNSLGWVIPKSTAHPKEAKKVLAYLGSKEAQDIMAKSAISAYEDSPIIWADHYKDNGGHAFTEPLNEDSVVILPFARKEANRIFTILNNDLTEIIATGKIEKRLPVLEAKINVLLA